MTSIFLKLEIDNVWSKNIENIKIFTACADFFVKITDKYIYKSVDHDANVALGIYFIIVIGCDFSNLAAI